MSRTTSSLWYRSASFILHSLLFYSVHSEPLFKSFTSCLSQHSNSLASPDQLINFTHLWTQFDTGQDHLTNLPPHESQSPHHDILRIALVGQVGSQSTGYSPQTNFLATLISETSVLNFQSFSNQSALCSSIRTANFSSNSSHLDPETSSNVVESGCPYGPGDVALGVSIPLGQSGYPFMTLSTQLQILDTSTPALTLACIQLDTTPYHSKMLYYKLLKWISIGLIIGYLLVGWSGRIWAAIISEQLNREAQVAATMDDPFEVSSNRAGRFASFWWLVWSGQGLLLSGALLRFSTPGTRDIFNHLQFIALLGLFSVQWPEFAYPILTQTAWTTLVFNSTFVRSNLPSLISINPIATPSYQPPQSFSTQFDTVGSPLYLNRTLPNVLLNFGDQPQGIPRWAMTIGILPSDIFPLSIATFALISFALAALSALTYLVSLISSMISLNRSSTYAERHESTILNRRETNDGMNYSPPSALDYQDKMRTNRHPEKNSPDGIHASWAADETNWPEISRHFALLQGNLLRLFILLYLPIVTFSSHQLTLFHTASTVSFVMAAILLLVCAIMPIFQLHRVKGHSTEELIDNLAVVLALGPLYNTYDDKNELFMGIRFASSFVVGVVIGAAQSSAMTQSVVLLVAELTETMLTSLWLPWGDGAAMAPLTFISSVSRIITAVILVVLTPTVSVGSVASGWLTYVMLLILGFVLLIFLGALLVKLFELLLRLCAHIPFDETKSTRSGGLRGAFRRWDRTASRSTRHGRAAAIAARRRRRLMSKSISSKPPQQASTVRRNSMFSVLNGQSSTLVENPKKINLHPQTTSPGFMTMNDDDGNIMSAMSQGPWLRTHTSETPFANLASYPNSTNHQPMPPDLTSFSVGNNSSTSSSGFAVVRGGRASEKTPYQMHNDGRNTWRLQALSSHTNHHYPPISSQHAQSLPSDLHIQRCSPPGPSFYQNSGTHPNASRTTTNLFESTPYSSHGISDRRAEKAKKSITLFQRLNWSKRRNDGNTSSEDDSDDTDLEDEIEESIGGRKGRLEGLLSGLTAWTGRSNKCKSITTDNLVDNHDFIEQASAPEVRGFQVVRQPRPKPSPVGLSHDSKKLALPDSPKHDYMISSSSQPE